MRLRFYNINKHTAIWYKFKVLYHIVYEQQGWFIIDDMDNMPMFYLQLHNSKIIYQQ